MVREMADRASSSLRERLRVRTDRCTPEAERAVDLEGRRPLRLGRQSTALRLDSLGCPVFHSNSGWMAKTGTERLHRPMDR